MTERRDGRQELHPPGAVEAAIGVAEHPANQGVVGFNPAIRWIPCGTPAAVRPGPIFPASCWITWINPG